ncbi:MAG: copper amine oxidase N-terminal domain-containing protein [Clostridia bacterium]|nr:copper amine oxidase N-terminal domain-containing protein [Clostridia bacterium]
MKKIIALVLAIVLCTSFAAFAQPVFDESMNVTVVLDGKTLEFDQKPLVEDGRTLVPVRKIFESLGATVDYDEATETVISRKGNLIIVMQIDNDVMFVNGIPVKLEVPAREVNWRTLVPLHAISDAMDVDVSWDEVSQTATLTSK